MDGLETQGICDRSELFSSSGGVVILTISSAIQLMTSLLHLEDTNFIPTHDVPLFGLGEEAGHLFIILGIQCHGCSRGNALQERALYHHFK